MTLERWQRPLEIAAVACALNLSACVGSWAQDTHVDLRAIPPSTVTGIAEVSQAVDCSGRCVAVAGSDILLTLSGTRAEVEYNVLLARGTCSSLSDVRVIATGAGYDLVESGGRIHVDTLIHALVKTNYVLAVQEAGKAKVAACGAISSDAPY